MPIPTHLLPVTPKSSLLVSPSKTSLPCVLPPHSIVSFVWELSSSGTSSKIMFDEVIPHQDDLEEIVRDIPLAERNGYDAILVQLGEPVQSHVCQYTISKIRLMMNIHNSSEVVKLASALSHWLTQRHKDPHLVWALKFLQHRPILSNLPGFVSPIPVYMLGCLVSDIDILDDVLDTCMEIAYLRLSTCSALSTPIILPTTFALSLLQLYHQEVRQFNYKCLAL
ncbi:hypothetical protein FRC04_009082 [Tulasnella sp. 424]|nr:hypothetical protein FRC04_009082 [Tulasnella sp. 424]KAG8977089.1 hypothetical protein FRC05_002611 [Tulasnella sp. 425]